MDFDEIIYEKANRVAVITLNRPARLNAWTSKMESELREALLDSEHDDKVGAIVITGAGKAYCAGADMGTLNRVADGTTSAVQAVSGEVTGTSESARASRAAHRNTTIDVVPMSIASPHRRSRFPGTSWITRRPR